MNKPPYMKVKIFGGWDLTFWENEHTINNNKFKSLDPVLSKSFKDKKGEWINQAVPISLNALYRLLAMGSRIKSIEDNYKEEKKNDNEETKDSREEDVK